MYAPLPLPLWYNAITAFSSESANPGNTEMRPVLSNWENSTHPGSDPENFAMDRHYCQADLLPVWGSAQGKALEPIWVPDKTFFGGDCIANNAVCCVVSRWRTNRRGSISNFCRIIRIKHFLYSNVQLAAYLIPNVPVVVW